MNPPGKVVIIGGGIHGVSTAYYLSKRNVCCTVVESVGIGAAASGKSGGFLAREWGSGVTIPLHQISFDMHRDLAKLFNLETYRQITTLSVDGSRRGDVDAGWLDGIVSSSIMDSQTAQVTPMELTSKFMEFAQAAGASLVHGTVDHIIVEEGVVRGVSIADQGVLEADRVVLCMGPWTGALVEAWLGLPLPMEGIKSTSVLFSACDLIQTQPMACFCEEDGNGCHLELYPRPNGDLYVCGLGGSSHVSGSQLLPGGEFASAVSVQGDVARAGAACSSLRGMVSSLARREPDVVQVRLVCLSS